MPITTARFALATNTRTSTGRGVGEYFDDLEIIAYDNDINTLYALGFLAASGDPSLDSETHKWEMCTSPETVPGIDGKVVRALHDLDCLRCEVVLIRLTTPVTL